MAATTRQTTLLECLPFVIDSWNKRGNATLKPHFLTHCHKDHTDGIDYCAVDVFCTDLTRRLLLLRQPGAGRNNRFHIIQPGVPLELTYRSVTFTVTPLDANHCPGSVMLLFQGCFGNILHTGDCRFTSSVVRSVQEALRGPECECDYGTSRGAYAGSGLSLDFGCGCSCGRSESLDLIYLDCTFADLPLDFPSREEAVRHAAQLICRWSGSVGANDADTVAATSGAIAAPISSTASTVASHGAVHLSSRPSKRVFLSSDLLGTEQLLAMAGEVFGQPLYVCPPERYKEYGFANEDIVRQRREELEMLVPGLHLSDDPSCFFHLCGVRDFAHRGTKQGQELWQQQQRGLKLQLPALRVAIQGDGEGPNGLPPVVASPDPYGGTANGGCLYIRASTQAFGQRIREQYARYALWPVGLCTTNRSLRHRTSRGG
ncbi:hypothetical protein Vafri_15095 [Volvox africanus]|nr:hypothetical protein Vafri_15095 [Volvox africanus]